MNIATIIPTRIRALLAATFLMPAVGCCAHNPPDRSIARRLQAIVKHDLAFSRDLEQFAEDVAELPIEESARVWIEIAYNSELDDDLRAVALNMLFVRHVSPPLALDEFIREFDGEAMASSFYLSSHVFHNSTYFRDEYLRKGDLYQLYFPTRTGCVVCGEIEIIVTSTRLDQPSECEEKEPEGRFTLLDRIREEGAAGLTIVAIHIAEPWYSLDGHILKE